MFWQVGMKNGQGMTKSMSAEILHQYNKQVRHPLTPKTLLFNTPYVPSDLLPGFC